MCVCVFEGGGGTMYIECVLKREGPNKTVCYNVEVNLKKLTCIKVWVTMNMSVCVCVCGGGREERTVCTVHI